MSTTINSTPFLRFALLGDAAASGLTGLLMAGASGPLSSLLGLPSQLLFWAGLVLLPYAAIVAFVGKRPRPSTFSIWAIIAANTVWVIDSLALLVSGWVQPTALGYVFVVGQALVVLAFAEAQFLGLRKATRRSEHVNA
jgi:hypothetical protein